MKRAIADIEFGPNATRWVSDEKSSPVSLTQPSWQIVIAPKLQNDASRLVSYTVADGR
jgi:hypothetical protein